MHMGLRGPKSRIIDVACINKECKNYGKIGTGSVVSNGTYFTQSGKVHKYICRECGRVFCERQGTAFYDIRSPEDKMLLSLKLILQGLSLRAVSNVLGVKLDTVRFWLTRSAAHGEQVNDALVKQITVARVELDELWSFVRKKNFRGWQRERKRRMAHAGSGLPWHQNTD
jgi:transposase-like protein